MMTLLTVVAGALAYAVGHIAMGIASEISTDARHVNHGAANDNHID